MENRQITIIDSATQSKHVINTNATTFGELKQLVKQAGVDINGKDWLEGFTKTSPRSDDSILPSGVTYKGQKTNNLIYMLTNTQKRIRSGASARQEVYAKVKALGLQDAVQKKFGKNFTRCKTDELVAFVAEHSDEEDGAKAEVKAGVPTPSKNNNAAAKAEELKAAVNNKDFGKEHENDLSPAYNAAAKAVAQLIVDLKIKDVVLDYVEKLTPKDINLSQTEIDKMFKK